MDIRTGRTYDTKEAALAARVPESDIAEIVGHPDAHPQTGEIVRFSSGPFKDRAYRRRSDGSLQRVRVSGNR